MAVLKFASRPPSGKMYALFSPNGNLGFFLGLYVVLIELPVAVYNCRISQDDDTCLKMRKMR